MTTDNVIPLDKRARLWKNADEARQRGIDAYIDFCRACAELADAGVLIREIAQRYDMSNTMSAQALAIGRDERIFGITENHFPRSEHVLYLLTTLDDAGFSKLAKSETTQDMVNTYKAAQETPAATGKKGRPRKGRERWSWMRVAVEEGALLPGGGDRGDCKAHLQRINPDPDLFAPEREADLRQACRALCVERANKHLRTTTSAPAVERSDLSLSAQEKLDRAIRHYQRELELKLRASYWTEVQTEVDKRLPLEQHNEIERAKRQQKNAEFLRDLYHARVDACNGAITAFYEHWRTIAAALHPDRAPEDRREQFTKASAMLNTIKAAFDRIPRDKQ